MVNISRAKDTVYCAYCLPTKRTSHLGTRLDFYNEKFVGFLFKPFSKFLLKLNSRARDIIWGKFLEILELMGLIRFVSDPDESQMHDRNSMFFTEAKKRGIRIEATWIPRRASYGNDFRFWHRGKKYYYDSIPLTMYASTVDIDDKMKIKKLLARNNIPVPEGKMFYTTKGALKYASKIGYPVVVKPNSASLSMHLTVNIQNAEELKKAAGIAKKYEPVFIVEKFILGDLYRATVIAQRQVLVCQRDAANVVGNGKYSIKELIQKRNEAEQRNGRLRADGTMAFEISLKFIYEHDLLAPGLDIEYIPKKGEKVYITKKFAPQTGNDIVIATEKTHPENKKLILKVARLLKTDIVGIDLIFQDISRPFFNQQMAVLETNSIPYTNVHQFPSSGKSEPVASLVWDEVLSRLSK